mgnify:CR=1 FL=1
MGVPEEELTPWWRVLKKGGFLNPKFPGGTEAQQEREAAEKAWEESMYWDCYFMGKLLGY